MVQKRPHLPSPLMWSNEFAVKWINAQAYFLKLSQAQCAATHFRISQEHAMPNTVTIGENKTHGARKQSKMKNSFANIPMSIIQCI